MTDASGNVLTRTSFDPFGGRRESNWSRDITAASLVTLLSQQDERESRGFTDHEQLRTGFIHMNGRVYDPRIGRFVSMDPVTDYDGGSQALNPYAYVMNSPTRFIDPSGYAEILPNGDVWPGVGGGGNASYPIAWVGQGPGTGNVGGVWASPAVISGSQGAGAKGHWVFAPFFIPADDNHPDAGLVANIDEGDQTPADSISTPNATFVRSEVSVAPGLWDQGGFVWNWLGMGVWACVFDGCTGRQAASEVGWYAISILTRGRGSARGVGVGAHAGESIAARSAARNFTAAERAEINRIGSKTGCHTCGTTNPGTKSGNFVPDHQPPSSLNPPGGPQQLYPQCIGCSREQGLELARQLSQGTP